jgi:hypothetical protein
VLITDVLAVAEDTRGISVPLVVAAAIVAVAWLVVLAVVRVARRPPHIDTGPLTQEPPGEPPAIAGLLCDDFELASELPPATLLDLAPRRIIRLEEVQPGKTICRVRQAPDERVLAPTNSASSTSSGVRRSTALSPQKLSQLAWRRRHDRGSGSSARRWWRTHKLPV